MKLQLKAFFIKFNRVVKWSIWYNWYEYKYIKCNDILSVENQVSVQNSSHVQTKKIPGAEISTKWIKVRLSIFFRETQISKKRERAENVENKNTFCLQQSRCWRLEKNPRVQSSDTNSPTIAYLRARQSCWSIDKEALDNRIKLTGSDIYVILFLDFKALGV